ncbi:MAG: DUF58 domain-containing protein [Serpentinimonas sp.]|nr:DUF58 domain-containing protein [Serpentinimonas sp.]
MPPDAATAPSAAPASGSADKLLQRLEWTSLRRLEGLLQGDYRTLMRGAGLDLADLREYQLHDDVRHIDWNVTARLQQPHVRQFTEDREMTVWFLLDLSASVDFGSGDRTKRQTSAELVGTLARLLTRHGNRVGAVLYGDGVQQVLPAHSGRRHVLHLLQSMMAPGAAAATRSAAPAKASAHGVTRLTELLSAGVQTMKRRSTVFVVSDFISQPGWDRPLAQLVQKHDVVAVRLVDPLELDLPNLGLITLHDAETGEHMLVDTGDQRFRGRFARIAAQREAELMEGLSRGGADTLELSTDDDLVDTLMRFIDLRRRRQRLRAA